MERQTEKLMAAECLSGRIRKLVRVVNSIFDNRYRPFGVRSSQVSILVVIGVHGPVAATDVCRKLCLEKSTLSRDLDRLIENGWVVATGEAGGGRRRMLEVTETGRELIRNVQPAWSEAQAKVRKLLGDSLSAEIFRVVNDSFSAAEIN